MIYKLPSLVWFGFILLLEEESEMKAVGNLIFLWSLWASLVAQLLKNPPAMQETWVPSLGREDPPGERNSYPLQYSCLKNSMDREAWWITNSPWGHKESDMTEQLTHHNTDKS